jgi:hypothetical protein
VVAERTLSEHNAPPDDARRQHVLRACGSWERALADFSRRNGLLYFRDSKVSTVELSDAPAAAIARLLDGKRVRLSELVSDEADARLARAGRAQEGGREL